MGSDQNAVEPVHREDLVEGCERRGAFDIDDEGARCGPVFNIGIQIWLEGFACQMGLQRAAFERALLDGTHERADVFCRLHIRRDDPDRTSIERHTCFIRVG